MSDFAPDSRTPDSVPAESVVAVLVLVARIPFPRSLRSPFSYWLLVFRSRGVSGERSRTGYSESAPAECSDSVLGRGTVADHVAHVDKLNLSHVNHLNHVLDA